jgi:magnesium transporter
MDTAPNRTCLARLPGGELQVLGAADMSTIDVLRAKPDHVVWLDIAHHTADDLALLRDEFDVHPLALEDQILAGGEIGATLRAILGAKRELLELRRTLSPQRDVANALLRRDLALVDDASAPYFQDLYDHLIRVLDQLDLQRDLLASALEANLSVTSNNLNAVMKRLTAFTVILMVPTLIAGIYGMNFRSMPELAWPLGYPFSLAVMAASMVGAAVFFKRHDWF